MSWGKCQRCGQYGAAVEQCPCKPFWCYADEESLAENGAGDCVWAEDAERAAIKYAEKWANFDSSYCDGGEVWVRNANQDVVTLYEIHCSLIPNFTAKAVKNGATED